MTKQRHPLIGASLPQFLKMAIQNGGVSSAHLRDFGRIAAVSALLTPLHWREARLFNQKIEDTVIEKPPIFILGHWRSGTTMLQNIMCNDPSLGYLNLIQSIFPKLFLTMEERFQKRMTARTRMMDNVELNAQSPTEEEIPMAISGPGSFWNGYYFPTQLDYYYEKYVMFRGISEEELQTWKNAYLWLLKKLTLRYDGKQLLLKNPPNTCRIQVLLDMFPNAKFVHIYRSPFEVYASRMAQYETSVLPKALQSVTKEQWEERVLRYYREIMQKHLEERVRIPEGNYVEVSFDDLRRNPWGEVERIYRDLEIASLDSARPCLEAYLATIKNYKQNRYQYPQELIDKVTCHWGFALEQWNYTPAGV